MLLCLDKSYCIFLWFICPFDSLIHFPPSAWCIQTPILRFHINNTSLSFPRNYMRQSLHRKKIFFRVNTAVQSNWEQIISEHFFRLAPPSQVKPTIFFSKLNLVIMSMIESERFFASVPFVLGMPRWWCPFLVPRNDGRILKKSPHFWQTSTDQISGQHMGSC